MRSSFWVAHGNNPKMVGREMSEADNNKNSAQRYEILLKPI
jgi:hypothetical protein